MVRDRPVLLRYRRSRRRVPTLIDTDRGGSRVVGCQTDDLYDQISVAGPLGTSRRILWPLAHGPNRVPGDLLFP